MVNLDDYSKNQSEYDLWPYEYYAKTIELINAGEPTSLGIDQFFTLSVDTVGWRKLLTAVEDSYVSVNPYLVEYRDEEKTKYRIGDKIDGTNMVIESCNQDSMVVNVQSDKKFTGNKDSKFRIFYMSNEQK